MRIVPALIILLSGGLLKLSSRPPVPGGGGAAVVSDKALAINTNHACDRGRKRRLGPPLGPGTTREDLQEHICHRVLTCSSQITARLKRNANSSGEERGFSSATTGYAKTERGSWKLNEISSYVNRR